MKQPAAVAQSPVVDSALRDLPVRLMVLSPLRLTAAAVCLVVAACAQQAVRPGGDAAPQVDTQQPKVVIAKPAPREAPLPGVELTDDIMFKLLLAELALQRSQPQVAVRSYLDLARDTNDPRIARRAAEIAWNARDVPAALEAAALWLQSDPESSRARQFMGALLVNQEKLEDAMPHLAQWLATDRSGVGHGFIQLSGLLARHKDKAGASRLVQALARDYPKVPEARLAVAQAAWNAGDVDLALQEARAALALKPDWEVAALFQAQALQKRSNAEAIAYLAGFLKVHPDARDARLNYARLLVTEKKFPEARTQFELLLSAHPQNAEVTMAVALLAMQANDYDAAETQLKRALELNYKDPDAVRLYLGQLSEERKRYDQALQWYAAVARGEQYINAQSRYAGVLAKQGRLPDARQHLQQVSPQNNQQRVQLTQAEAQLLRDASAYQEAFELLGRALEKLPNAPDLLYDHAMAAEKVDRLDVLEANLRKLIKIRPDHAHAYNALGYTLADRSQRLAEARELISTALELAPDDPFILDSMGWVLFRLGEHEGAIAYLKRAFTQRQDPEIAAHLGEVLWVAGERDEARKVWNDALKEHPKSEVLQNTIKRFVPASPPAQ